MKFFGKRILVVVFMVSLLFVSGSAGAYEFLLWKGNVTGNLLEPGLWDNPAATGPFANVNVSLNEASTIATITFTSLDGYRFVDGKIADLNVSGAFDVNESLTSSFLSEKVPSQVDGFGTFNLVMDSSPNKNFGDGIVSMTIVIQKVSGTWVSDETVLIANATNGYLAAAHIGVPDGAGGASKTGFAAGDGTTGSVVPVPPSVWLLGTGLIGFWGIRRRFLKK